MYIPGNTIQGGNICPKIAIHFVIKFVHQEKPWNFPCRCFCPWRSFKVARSFSPAVLISEGRPYTIYTRLRRYGYQKTKGNYYIPSQNKKRHLKIDPSLGKGGSHWKPIIFRVQMMFSGGGFCSWQKSHSSHSSHHTSYSGQMEWYVTFT